MSFTRGGGESHKSWFDPDMKTRWMFARFLSAIIHDSLDVISKISVRLDKEHVNSRCSEYLGLECKISANSRSL